MKVQSAMLVAILAIASLVASCSASRTKPTDAASGSARRSDAQPTDDLPEDEPFDGAGTIGDQEDAALDDEQDGEAASFDADPNREMNRAVDAQASTCPFPTSFRWTSTGALAEPKSPPGHNFISLKDFTAVKWKDNFIVYASVFDTRSTYSAVNLSFPEWSRMGAVAQTWMEGTPAGATVAPTLIYFSPKKQWVMTFQWGFKYSTNSDPMQPSKWTAPKSLFASRVANSETGPIDPTVICDTSRCYLFFTATNGSVYRSSMPIGNFPGTFPTQETLISEARSDAFEGVQVYAVKGSRKYLMVVEAIGRTGARFFRAFSADSLAGKFTAIPGASSEATPFAGKNNVTFTSGTAWTNDIAEGDVVRDDPSETQTIDPCKMQFLYQGVDPTKTAGNPGEIPYRPGLLTLVR